MVVLVVGRGLPLLTLACGSSRPLAAFAAGTTTSLGLCSANSRCGVISVKTPCCDGVCNELLT